MDAAILSEFAFTLLDEVSEDLGGTLIVLGLLVLLSEHCLKLRDTLDVLLMFLLLQLLRSILLEDLRLRSSSLRPRLEGSPRRPMRG